MTDQAASQDRLPFLIAGIGASAGGIEALTDFFGAVPADSGVAYAVILHLSPDHDSQLASVLQNVASIPVTKVTERTKVEPDHIYVIPPAAHLTMVDGHIEPSANLTIEDRRAPVDIFFRSLAETHGPRAVAVVLSGTGSNGSMGLKRVKEDGGIVLVQNPREAQFSEMARAAIATDFVDAILPVADIPVRIMEYAAQRQAVHLPDGRDDQPHDLQTALREIFGTIRVRTGHDFSQYKRPTLLRRIERRMGVHGIGSVPAYAALVKENADETAALLKDFLISVTNFFRDAEAFRYLESEVVPRILAGKTGEDTVRVWVTGCATGEEAYSLAMIFHEYTFGKPDAPVVQIFASDIDEAAIAHAREGLYSLNDCADISPERLRRFFTPEPGDHFRVRRELRESVLFALHNVLKDPPFSHQDLVSCRNILIYLSSPAQERVMETFHFALKPGGFLFLGSAESVDGASDIYAPVSKPHHVYQSRLTSGRLYPVSHGNPMLHHADAAMRASPTAAINPPKPAPRAASNASAERVSFGELHQRLLEVYAPPSVVVNEDYNIVHVSERAGRYLQVTGGEPSPNLLTMVRPELRLELRTALYSAPQRAAAGAVSAAVPITVEGREERVVISVRAVMRDDDPARGFILVVFEQAVDEGSAGADFHPTSTADEPVARQLEEELTRVKRELRTNAAQYELQAEDLRASNEELQAINEELRSAAEELETSKEELQSVNEELRTVNQELKVKIEEVTQAGNNLQNLMQSTDIGTVFLDRGFRVAFFTPAASALFNFIAADVGRPLSDITNKLEGAALLESAATVLETLQTTEREVTSTDGRVFLMRVSPYRSAEHRIQGVVMAFVDITERRQAEEKVAASEARLQRMVNVPRVGVLTFEYSGRMLHANDAFLQMVDYSREEFEAKPRSWRDFTPPEYTAVSEAMVEQVRTTGRGGPYEKEYYCKDGSRVWMMFVAADLGDGTFVEYALDISDRKRAEDTARVAEERLHRALEAGELGTFVWHVAEDRGEPDARMRALFGMGDNDAMNLGDALATMIHPDDRERYAQAVARASDEEAGMGGLREEFRIVLPDGTERWLNIIAQTSFNEGPRHATEMHGTAVDITDRKEAEARQDFLIALSDSIRPLSSAAEILEATTRTAQQYFGTDRCYYCKISGDTVVVRADAHREGLASVAGSYSLAAYPLVTSAWPAGGPMVVSDVRSGSGMAEWLREVLLEQGILACINVPVMKDGALVGAFCLTHQTPRQWTEVETDVAMETAERTWAAVGRARAEEALRESEERMRLVISSARGFAILTLRPDRTVDSWSPGAAEAFGWSEEEIIGQSVDVLFTPEDRAAGMPETEAAEAARTGAAPDKRWHLCKDGRRVYIDGYSHSLRNPAGTLTGFVKIGRDLTAQHRAEEALRASEERLQRAMDISTVGIIFFTLDGTVHDANDAFQRMSGYGLDDFRQGRVRSEDMTPPEFIEATRRSTEEFKTKGQNTPYEKQYIRPDGTRWWGLFAGKRLSEGECVEFVVDITEVKESEEALRGSEERLRLAAAVTGFGIHDLDIRTGRDYWSPELRAMHGIDPDFPLTFDSTQTFIHPDDRDRIRTAMHAAMDPAGNGEFEEEFRARRADTGKVLWLYNRARTQFSEESGGRVAVRNTGIVVDITSRKEAERRMEEARERLRIAVYAADMGTWDWDLRTNKTYWNEKHFTLFGMEPEPDVPVTPEVFFRRVHPDDREWVKERLERSVAEKTVFEAEFRSLRDDRPGEIFWMQGYGKPMMVDKKGRTARMSGVMQDVTARKRAEDELRTSEQRYQTFVQQSTEGIWRFEMQKPVPVALPVEEQIECIYNHAYLAECNDALAQQHGYVTAEEIIGSSITVFQPRGEATDAYLRAFIESGYKLVGAETREAGKAGDEVWLSNNLLGIVNDGHLRRAWGTQSNVTERRLAEQRKEEFLGVASHELKTPVTSVKAYAEMLQEMLEESGDQDAALMAGKLDAQVDRISALIRDLLDATRAHEGRLVLQKETVDIAALVHETVDSLQHTTSEHTIAIEGGFPVPLVEADRPRIAQILNNLLGNAIKYSPGGGRIAVRAAVDGGMLVLSVQDFGVGIAEEAQARVFERFYRVSDPAASTFPGLGLGLYISAEIARLHGGMMWVESKRREGSTFFFSLPLE